MAGDDDEVLELDGREVRLSSPGKLLFAERGETKRDVVDYYVRVREPLLRTMGGRPVLMQRFPSGAGGPSFFQKRVPKNAPEWLETTTVTTVNGTPSRALVIADLAHVAWAVNLGCLGFHVWPYRAEDPATATSCASTSTRSRAPTSPTSAARPPGSRRCSTSSAWPATPRPRATAGCTSTSASCRAGTPTPSVPPRWRSPASSSAGTPTSSPRRGGRRSAASGSSSTTTRTPRTRRSSAPGECALAEGGQVSAPLSWEDVFELHPDELTMATVPDRLDRLGDPWQDIDDAPQSLEPMLAMHERDRANGLLDAPWPPVYPKMPDEPPRVAPSRARKDQ